MMTRDELKKEADKLYIEWERGYCKEPIPDLLVMFTEPREKRIAELETRCNELFLQTYEQAEKIAELEKENAELKLKLEAQIEK